MYGTSKINTAILSHIFPIAGSSKISTTILSHIFPIAGTSKISIGMGLKRLLNNINIEALSMMNPLSIATIHAMR
jgi:hypothetical protein